MENRDRLGAGIAENRLFRQVDTHSTDGWNPARRGDFRQEKGPGDYPSPSIWWWDGTRHQTTIESTESKRCGLLRTGANWIEKPAGTPGGTGRSSRFFGLIGSRNTASTSSAFRGQFNSEKGTEPASRSPSTQAVPNSTATAMLIKCAAFHQRPEMLLERVAAGAGQLDSLANGDAPMLAGELDDL
ncbi:hypothetical protein SAMN05216317_1265 [Nitrosomonas eutropha]|nr:hypothetical protein SAMN05216317_1265 [Nitrosomonas eutropha]